MSNDKYPKCEIPFEQAVVSFKGYPSIDKIPAMLFRRIQEIMDEENVAVDEAADAIQKQLNGIGVTREQIIKKLKDCPPSSPDNKVVKLFPVS